MEGTQTLTFCSGFILIFLIIYNLIYDIDAYEYYYLIGPVFIVSLLISYNYIYQKLKHLKTSIMQVIRKI